MVTHASMLSFLMLTLVSLVLSGCGSMVSAGTTDAPALADERSESPYPAVTQSGNYLAARHAEAVNDWQAALTFNVAALAGDQTDPSLMRRALTAAIRTGEVEKAVPLAKALVTLDRGGHDAHALTIGDAVRAGDREAALARIEALPSSPLAGIIKPFLRSWAVLGSPSGHRALEVLQAEPSVEGLETLQAYHVLLLATALDNQAEATSAMEKLPEPQGTRVVLAKSIFLARSGETAAALSALDDVTQRTGDTDALALLGEEISDGVEPALLVATADAGIAEVFLNLADLLNRDDTRDVALAFARIAAWLRPDLDEAHLLSGDILDRLDMGAFAAEAYQAVGDPSSVHWEAQLRLAGVLEDLGDLDSAEEVLRDAQQDRAQDYRAARLLGDLYRRDERFDDAVHFYDIAIDKIGTPSETDWSAFYVRGIAHERTKNWPAAEQDFLTALDLNPDQPYVLNYLGYMWADRGENLDRAEDMIRRAVELSPGDGFIVDSLGWVLYRLGDDAGAVQFLERATELTPADPVINDHLGDAYWMVGRKTEARLQWRRALGLVDDDPDLADSIREKLSGKPPERDGIFTSPE